MVILIIILVLAVFVAWLLISPLILKIDTRVPEAGVWWLSIGSARVWFDNEWWFSLRLPFFKKTMRFSEINRNPKKAKNRLTKKSRKKRKPARMLVKMLRVIKSCRVIEWQLAVDTGDYASNARLFPLNYLPYTFEHVYVNFRDDNYLVLKIRNRPWKMLYAFLH